MSEITGITPDPLEKVRSYAETQAAKGFVWVYRAEGKHDAQLASLGRTELAGTWFTPSFKLAQAQVAKLHTKDIPEVQIVAMVIPQSHLDTRDWMSAGMNEVNVIFRKDARVIVVDAPITEPPTADTYVQQFDLNRP